MIKSLNKTAVPIFVSWILFYCFLQIYWLGFDTRPPAWDEAHHLRIAYTYKTEFFSGQWLNLLLPHDLNYPPFYHWTLAFVLKFFKDVPDCGGYLNSIYSVFLMIASFFLAKAVLLKIKCEENADHNAVLVSIVLSSFPLLFYFSHFPLIDIALTFWVAFALLAMIQCENFSNRKWSVLFGTAWAFGMLTKWSFFTYVLAPSLWIVCLSFKENKKNILYSLGIFLLIALPWYLPNLIYVLRRMGLSSHGESIDPERGSLGAWIWYAKNLVTILGIPGTIFFIAGVIFCCIKKQWFWLFLGFIVPYIFWSLTQNKDFRYFLPVLPSLSILSLFFLKTLNKKLKVLIIIICAVQLVYSGFASNRMNTVHLFGIKIPGLKSADSFPPLKENWNQETILYSVLKNKNTSEWVILRTTSPNAFLSNISLRYAAFKEKLYDQIKPMGNPPYEEYFSFTDFVLDHTGGWNDPGSSEFQNHQEIKNSFWFKKTFKEIERWPVPENLGDVVLYQLNPSFNFNLNLEKIAQQISQISIDPEIKTQHRSVKIIPINSKESSRGHFNKILIKTTGTEFRDIPLGEITAEAEDIYINLALLQEKNILRLLKLKQITPYIKIKKEDIEKILQQRLSKYLSDIQIVLENQKIKISALAKYGFHVKVQGSVNLAQDSQGKYLLQNIEMIQVGKIKIPHWLYSCFTTRKHYINATSSMPFDLNLEKIIIQDGILQINEMKN